MSDGKPAWENKEYDLYIANAGNTVIPCLQAIAAKGYTVDHYFLGEAPGEWDHPQWVAEKDQRIFFADSPNELLGLIAMWEVRGDDWQIKDGEVDLYDDFVKTAPMYNNDGDVVDT